MAKPRELFNTPAPQAMSQMGAGIAEAYANAGRIQGQGVAAMGESIGKGIQAGVSAYAGYAQQQKQIESQSKSYENFLNNKVGQATLGYSQEQATQLIEQAKKLSLESGIRAGNDFLNLAVGGRLQQQNKLQLVNAEVAGRALGAQKPPMLNNPDDIFGSIFSGTPVAPKTPAAVVPVDQLMQGQDTTQPATDLAAFLRQRGWNGRGPVPQALMNEYNALIGR